MKLICCFGVWRAESADKRAAEAKVGGGRARIVHPTQAVVLCIPVFVFARIVFFNSCIVICLWQLYILPRQLYFVLLYFSLCTYIFIFLGVILCIYLCVRPFCTLHRQLYFVLLYLYLRTCLLMFSLGYSCVCENWASRPINCSCNTCIFVFSTRLFC